MASRQTDPDWEQECARWLTPLLAALGHKARRRWAPVYLRGLLGPGERTRVQSLAARVAPGDHEPLHHFMATSAWDPAPLEAALAREADRLVGGPEAVLILDDTTLLKPGRHSVGVARQYAGQAGQTANGQTLVSLTLARGAYRPKGEMALEELDHVRAAASPDPAGHSPGAPRAAHRSGTTARPTLPRPAHPASARVKLAK